MRIPYFAKAMAVLAAMVFCGESGATTSCVENSTALNIALFNWTFTSSSDPMEIRLARGTYAIAGTYVQENGNAPLQLLGGYAPGTGCSDGGRIVFPTDTVLDGGGGANNYFLLTGDTLTVDDLAFSNYPGIAPEGGFGGTAGASLEGISNMTASRFIGINTNVNVSGSAIRVENCLVYGAPGSNNRSSAALEVDADGSSAVINCTVADNSGRGLYLYTYDGGTLDVYNTIAWNNAAYDVTTEAASNGTAPSVSYSTFATSSGLISASHNSNANPKFVDEAGHDYQLNYSTTPISPAIDTGTLAALVPGTDIAGNFRPHGINVDKGAYESAYSSFADFIVTSTSDASHATDSTVNCNTNSTTCTLRQAILNANLNPSGSHVTFNLGSCPNLIVVGSPMEVTGKVTIDGYGQSGSVRNTAAAAFNATLCVELVGNAAAQALYVPSGSTSAQLTVQGFEFTGFSDAAIRLEDGGGQHLIRGNSFGSSLFRNNDAIRVTDNAYAIVGGSDDPWETNLIYDSTDAGVFLDSSTGFSRVAGNLIGIAADGSSAAGNYYGVLIGNSPGNLILDNYIGNNNTGISIFEGSNNSVRGNYIGVNAAGAHEGNSGAGIYLFVGANNTAIGPTNGSNSGFNYIAYNGGAGVGLGSSAGAGNSIRSNSIFGNTGLAIDLNNDGATANKQAVGVSGPNNWQNYPQLQHVLRTANGDLVLGQLTTLYDSGQDYHLDFYYNATCTTLGSPPRGDAGLYLGTADVAPNSSGFASFTLNVSVPYSSLALGYISVTATAPDGSTSEIGQCTKEINDEIFRNGFDQ